MANGKITLGKRMSRAFWIAVKGLIASAAAMLAVSPLFVVNILAVNFGEGVSGILAGTFSLGYLISMIVFGLVYDILDRRVPFLKTR